MKSMTITIICAFILCTCAPQPTPTAVIDRESVIPSDQVKISPTDDIYPPKSLTTEYSDPVPLPYPINTAGAEDSAFVTPDGKTLYIWFTPDPRLPAEMQLPDGVTGIYVSHKQPDGWSKPERVWLQENGKVALDGCEFILDKIMWFCTVREGYEGINWFTANLRGGTWQKWQPADFNPEYQVGELHITADGKELYFHSPRPGGKSGLDVWVSNYGTDGWKTPINVETINNSRERGLALHQPGWQPIMVHPLLRRAILMAFQMGEWAMGKT